MHEYPVWLVIIFALIMIRLLILQFRVKHISTEYYHNLITTCLEINSRLTLLRIHYKDINHEEWSTARSKINVYIDQQLCSVDQCIVNGKQREHAKRALAVLEAMVLTTGETIKGTSGYVKGPHLQ